MDGALAEPGREWLGRERALDLEPSPAFLGPVGELAPVAEVPPLTAVQAIEAIATEKRVIPELAEQGVVIALAEEPVIATSAEEVVAAVLAAARCRGGWCPAID